MRGLAYAGATLALLASTQAFATPAQLSSQTPPPERDLAWRGEERWRLTLAEETGLLRLAFIQVPGGDYLLTGTLQLDDAELGVTGSGRWRGGKLILDLSISGGVRATAPDEEKRRLFADRNAPALLDSAGFAMMRAELDPTTLDGITQQYQTNIVTGNRLQGPIYRAGLLRHVR
ncbi:hypothetical protein NDN01_06025 [Sphingomonas sp. QA11]|uniref:hypothetical protein n=1 Tax=Sphingomonas sp. QA11 TaxID=2950605 RepID=UPI00234959EC|nr:hypothetical protein [Sphingomonas sp. QA11]WCM28480.1 hypothetical protein NDN01_06025 [Sphingomonas sp. QA11]